MWVPKYHWNVISIPILRIDASEPSYTNGEKAVPDVPEISLKKIRVPDGLMSLKCPWNQDGAQLFLNI